MGRMVWVVAWLTIASTACASAPPADPVASADPSTAAATVPPTSDPPATASAATAAATTAAAAAATNPAAPADPSPPVDPSPSPSPSAGVDPSPSPSPSSPSSPSLLAAPNGPPSAPDAFTAKLRAGVRVCYENALRGDPTISGSVHVTADPSADKCRFVHVKFTSQGFSPSLTSCLRKTVIDATRSFDACKSSGVQPIAAPLNLSF